MIVSQRSSVTSSPASTLAFIAGPSADSTPTIRTSGRARLTAAETPEMSPPPPIGTTMTSTSGQSSIDLEPERPLAGDEVEIVERVHVDETVALDELARLLVGLVPDRSRAGRPPLRTRESPRPSRASRSRPCRRPRGSRASTRPRRDALRVVSGRGADDAAGALLVREQRELVQRPADLVRAGPLEALGLEPHVEAGLLVSACEPTSGVRWTCGVTSGRAARESGRARRSRRGAYSGGTVPATGGRLLPQGGRHPRRERWTPSTRGRSTCSASVGREPGRAASSGGGGGAGKAVFDDLLVRRAHEQGLAAPLAGVCEREAHQDGDTHLPAGGKSPVEFLDRSRMTGRAHRLVRAGRLRRRSRPLDQVGSHVREDRDRVHAGRPCRQGAAARQGRLGHEGQQEGLAPRGPGALRAEPDRVAAPRRCADGRDQPAVRRRARRRSRPADRRHRRRARGARRRGGDPPRPRVARDRAGTRGRCGRASEPERHLEAARRDRRRRRRGRPALRPRDARPRRRPADLPARLRRRRPRPRDHARHPRQGPPAEHGAPGRRSPGRSGPSRPSTSTTGCWSATTAASSRSASGRLPSRACASWGSRRRPCAPTSRSSTFRAATSTSTRPGSTGSAVDALGALSDEELAAAPAPSRASARRCAAPGTWSRRARPPSSWRTGPSRGASSSPETLAAASASSARAPRTTSTRTPRRRSSASSRPSAATCGRSASRSPAPSAARSCGRCSSPLPARRGAR